MQVLQRRGHRRAEPPAADPRCREGRTGRCGSGGLATVTMCTTGLLCATTLSTRNRKDYAAESAEIVGLMRPVAGRIDPVYVAVAPAATWRSSARCSSSRPASCIWPRSSASSATVPAVTRNQRHVSTLAAAPTPCRAFSLIGYLRMLDEADQALTAMALSTSAPGGVLGARPWSSRGMGGTGRHPPGAADDEGVVIAAVEHQRLPGCISLDYHYMVVPRARASTGSTSATPACSRSRTTRRRGTAGLVDAAFHPIPVQVEAGRGYWADRSAQQRATVSEDGDHRDDDGEDRRLRGHEPDDHLAKLSW